jgi:nucleotide-binding universal stress UspA family protein
MKIKPTGRPGRVMVEMDNRDSEQLANTAGAVSPFKLKKILVPVDFSDCSKKALLYAIPFARQFNARMIFLHILPVHYATGLHVELASYIPLLGEDLQKDAEKRLTRLVQENVPGEISVQIEVRRDSPSTGIVNAAKEMDVDFIVMSTHGHTGRIHAFIGSVAGAVVRLAPCPVLVVREKEREFVQNQSASEPLPAIAA